MPAKNSERPAGLALLARAGVKLAPTLPCQWRGAYGMDARILATIFLRKLVSCGWMAEEGQLDFSRTVTMCARARPFFEALDAVERDAPVEYESHIIAVYSSLCGDAAAENGEHAVLNAHWHTRLLIESLKVLEQNIKNCVQEMFGLDASIPEILHAHYDVYMHEVVDRAYTRLKTSDNLSRYRPRISRAISAFLKNEKWMIRTAEKLSVIQRATAASSRERLWEMLVEIRDELKGINPILEGIDDKNRRYSRISTERISSRLHADSSLQGKISRIVPPCPADSRAWGISGTGSSGSDTFPAPLCTPAGRGRSGKGAWSGRRRTAWMRR